MLELRRALIGLVFVIDDTFSNTDQAYVFSNPKSQTVSYDVFTTLLEPFMSELGEYDVHLMDPNDDIESFETHLSDFLNIRPYKQEDNESFLDIYDKENQVNRIFVFESENFDEISNILDYSCLKWFINDFKKYDEIESESQDALEEAEKEAEASKDPYSYYGVSRGDF